MKINSNAKKNGDVLSQVTLDNRTPAGFKRFRVVTEPSGRKRISSVDIGLGGGQCWVPATDIKGFDFADLLRRVSNGVSQSVANTKEWQG